MTIGVAAHLVHGMGPVMMGVATNKVNGGEVGGGGGLYFTLLGIIHMESMEWGVESRNSRWNPWNGGWTP